MRGLLWVLPLVAAVFGDVLEYGDSNFEEMMNQHAVALVKFYAPWCGHYKRMAPDFEAASKKLKVNDPPVALIMVDCTVEKETCDKFGVKGFPTLKIFRNGVNAQDYDGPRDEAGMIKYMRGQTGPSAKELKTKRRSEFEKFLSSDESVFVGFFESDSKLTDSLLKVADTERDRFTIAYTLIDVVVFLPEKLVTKLESGEFKYDGNYDKIKNFLVHDTIGLAGVRTQGNLFQFEQNPLVVVYYNVDYVKDPKGSNYWRNRVLKVAQHYKRRVHFAVSNKEEFASEVRQNGLGELKDSDKPIVAAITNDGKFPMDDEFSKENLKAFVDDVLAGKAEAYMKSDLPEQQEDVRVSVGKKFKELLLDADKNVLIEFCASWCGHCKSVSPKYEQLGSKVVNVIVARIDTIVIAQQLVIFFLIYKMWSKRNVGTERHKAGHTKESKETERARFEKVPVRLLDSLIADGGSAAFKLLSLEHYGDEVINGNELKRRIEPEGLGVKTFLKALRVMKDTKPKGSTLKNAQKDQPKPNVVCEKSCPNSNVGHSSVDTDSKLSFQTEIPKVLCMYWHVLEPRIKNYLYFESSEEYEIFYDSTGASLSSAIGMGKIDVLPENCAIVQVPVVFDRLNPAPFGV